LYSDTTSVTVILYMKTVLTMASLKW